MILNNRLWLALGVSGWALLSVLGKSRKKKSLQHEKTHKAVEMHRWEGEGGNLPPPVVNPQS